MSECKCIELRTKLAEVKRISDDRAIGAARLRAQLAEVTRQLDAAQLAMRRMAEGDSDGNEYAHVCSLKADLERVTKECDELRKSKDNLPEELRYLMASQLDGTPERRMRIERDALAAKLDAVREWAVAHRDLKDSQGNLTHTAYAARVVLRILDGDDAADNKKGG